MARPLRWLERQTRAARRGQRQTLPKAAGSLQTQSKDPGAPVTHGWKLREGSSPLSLGRMGFPGEDRACPFACTQSASPLPQPPSFGPTAYTGSLRCLSLMVLGPLLPLEQHLGGERGGDNPRHSAFEEGSGFCSDLAFLGGSRAHSSRTKNSEVTCSRPR